MSTFESLSKLDKIALCARAARYTITHRAHRFPPPAPSPNAVRVYVGKKAPFWYEPYIQKARAFELVEKFLLSILQSTVSSTVVATTEDMHYSSGACEDLATAICDCVARMQWEKERK